METTSPQAGTSSTKPYYYVDSENQPVGPHTIEELAELERQGQVTGITLVASEGDSEWKPWQEIVRDVSATEPTRSPDERPSANMPAAAPVGNSSSRRRPVLVSIAAALAVVLLIGAVVAYSLYSPKRRSAKAASLAEIRALAEQGDGQAQYDLGSKYEYGSDVPKDENESQKWYRRAMESFRKAAERNNAKAQYMLGRGYYYGEGMAENKAEGVKWYRKAAEQGYLHAQTSLGLYYSHDETKDEVESAKWYRKAAEQNDASAQYSLGSMYLEGQGVAKDEVEAVKWFRKAAEQNGDLADSAKYSLAHCYLEGKGVAKDEVEAMRWLQKAASGIDPFAKAELGSAYVQGAGVAKDEVEGYKWLMLSGYIPAMNAATEIARTMTPEQVAEGKRRISDYLKQNNIKVISLPVDP